MNSNIGGSLHYQNNPLHRPYDDEISLYELIHPVIEHWRTVLAITVAFALIGLILGILMPSKYLYSASIEIGTRAVEEGFRPIDHPQNVLAKISNGYIPLTLHDYHDRNIDAPSFDIKAKVPKQSEIIILDAKGTEEQGEVLKLLLSTIIEKVRADHDRVQVMMRKEIEVRRVQALNLIATLDEQEKLNSAKAERMDRAIELAEKQLEGLKVAAKQATRNRRSSIAGQSTAVAMLLRDDDRAVQEEISRLQERIEIEIPAEKDLLAQELTENRRQHAEAREEIAKLDIELRNFRETRAVIPPMRSLKPVGLGTGTTTVIAALAGFFLAALLMLVRASARKHRSLSYLR